MKTIKELEELKLWERNLHQQGQIDALKDVLELIDGFNRILITEEAKAFRDELKARITGDKFKEFGE